MVIRTSAAPIIRALVLLVGLWLPSAAGPVAGASLEVTSIIVTPQTTTAGQQVTARVSVRNTSVGTSTWEQRSPSTNPGALQSHAMAFDSLRGRTVLFGGFRSGTKNETWEWDGSDWSQRASNASPPTPREQAAMAYDSVRNVTVLFGGSGAGTFNDTWSWDGTTWVQRLPNSASSTVQPSQRSGAAIAFDSDRGRIVLFGGNTDTDTWEWDGTSWARMTVAGPGQRDRGALAYDEARGVSVLFGGQGTSGNLNDTWTWDGTTWTQKQASNASPGTNQPKGRFTHAMVYDRARQRVVLFGGFGSSGSLGDTWEWDGTAWTETTPSTKPTARDSVAGAYDSAAGRFVLYGGSTGGAETWLYGASAGNGLNALAATLNFAGDAAHYSTTYLGGSPATLASGASTVLSFAVRVDAAAVPGARSVTATVTATDSVTGQAASVTNTSSATLTVVAPAALSIGTMTASRSSINQGQGGLTVTMPVRNTGGAAATVNLARTGLTFNGSAAGYSVTTAGPSTIAGATTATYTFTVTAANNAPLGATTIDGFVGAIDSSTGADVSRSGASATASWTVQKPAALFVRAVAASPTKVERGQNISNVTVSVANTGGAAANAAGAGLTFNGTASGFTATASGANPAAIAGNTTATFTFTVAVTGTAPLGPVTLDATATGTDANSGVAVSDNSADVTDSFTVLTPAALAVRTVSAPSGLERSQSATDVTVVVANTGGADAVDVGATLSFSPSAGFSAVPKAGNPTAIPGNTTATFTFSLTIGATAPLGAVTVDATATGKDALTLTPVSDTRADTPAACTVVNPASLSIVNASFPASVQRGQTVTSVVVQIKNNAASPGAGASNLDVRLTIGASPGAYTIAQTSGASTVAPGVTQAFTFSVGVGQTAALGNNPIGLTVTARDAVTGAALAPATRTLAWTVVTPAKLVIRSVTAAPPVVERGQTIAGLTLTVANSGGVAAQNVRVSPSFNGSATGYVVTQTSGATTLASGKSANFVYTVAIGQTAPLGPTTLSGTATATDDMTGAPLSASSADTTATWTVVAPAELSFGNLQAPATVSQGQSFDATIAVANTGQQTAIVNGTQTLTFSGTGLTSSFVSASGSIASNSTGTFKFRVTVATNAPVGPRTATLAVAARDALVTTLSVGKTEALTPSVLVQSQPRLVIGSLTPSKISPGQTREVSVALGNAGQASALVTTSTLTFSAGGLVASVLSGNPSSVAGGVTATFRFSVKAPATGSPGTYTPTFAVTAKDANTGSAANASGPASPGMKVQAAAVLQVSAISMPASVNQGDRDIPATVTLRNTGVPSTGTAAHSIAGGLLFVSDQAGYTITTSTLNAATLAAGASLQLAFTVTVKPTALTGPRTVKAAFTARDADTDAEIKSTGTAFASVNVLPALPKIVIGALRAPPVVSQGQTFVASVGVSNEGNSAMLVQTSSLTFSGSGLTASAFPDNPASVPPGIGATQTFRYLVTVDDNALPSVQLATLALKGSNASGGAALSASSKLQPQVVLILAASLDVTSIGVSPPSTGVGRPGITVEVSVTNRGLGTPTWTLVRSSEANEEANGPEPRLAPGLVYDTQRHRTLLFGGVTTRGEFLNDSWEWDGTSWTERQSSSSEPDENQPPGRFGFAMVYDSFRKRALLFGGFILTTPAEGQLPFIVSNDLWEWNGSQWAQLQEAAQPPAQNQPPGRLLPAMAYDSRRHRTVLFGGVHVFVDSEAGQLGVSVPNGIWEWDGTAWSQALADDPKSGADRPGPLLFTALSYDSARQRTVLFGGLPLNMFSIENPFTNAVWEWDGARWALRPPATAAAAEPVARVFGALAFDEVRKQTILYGGAGIPGVLSETWELGPAGWSNTVLKGAPDSPKFESLPGMAFDSDRQKLVLFGPSGKSETWEYGSAGGGEDAARLAATLNLSGGSADFDIVPSAANAVSLAAGASAILTFTVTARPGAAAGTRIVTATVRANGSLSGKPVTIANDAVARFTITSPSPKLTIGSVSASAQRVSQGQTGLSVSMTVSSTLSHDVGVQAAGLLFNGFPEGYTVVPAQDNPSTVPAGGTATFRFSVSAGANAPLGDTVVDATIAATDSTNGADASADRGAVSPARWTVQSPAILSVDSIVASAAFIEAGQTGLSVRVRVTNAGSPGLGADASSLSAGLLFGGSASGYTVTALPTNAAVLSAGASTVLTFSVTAGAGLKAGPVSISAAVTARDANTGLPASVTGTPGASWTVLVPATVRVDAVTVTQPVVAPGQNNLPVRVRLTNTAPAGTGAPANLSPALLFNGSTRDFYPVASPANLGQLAAGATTVLTFTVMVGSFAPAGVTTVTVVAGATDAVTLAAAATVNETSATWLVVTRASLVLASIRPARSSVERGQRGLAIELAVESQDPRGSGLDLEGLAAGLAFGGSVDGYDVTAAPGNATRLAAGSSAVLTYSVAIRDSAGLGPVTISALPEARYTRTGTAATALASATASWTVHSPAALSIRSVKPSSALVRPGQAGLSVVISIENSGTARANLTTAALRFQGASDRTSDYRVEPVAPAKFLTGNSRADLVFVVDVASTASTEQVTLDAAITGLDAITGDSTASSVATTPGTWLVQRTPASLTLNAVTVPASRVIRGQSALPIEVTVSNSGQSVANLLGTTLSFRPAGGAAVAYPVSAADSNDGELAAGARRTLHFTVAVPNDAPLGVTTIDSAVFAVDAASGSDASARGASRPATWTVATAAALAVPVVRAPAEVSQGRTFPVTLPLRNLGTSDARLSGVALGFTRSGSNASPGDFTATAAAGNPVVVAGGELALLRFDVAVSRTAASGPFTVSATLSASDALVGSDARPSSLVGADSRVRSPASLTVASVRVPASAGQGQSFEGALTLTNSGESEATISSAGLVFTRTSPADANGDFLAQPDPQNATSVGAGRTVTLVLAHAVSSAATTGPVAVTGRIVAADSVTGADASASGPNGPSVLDIFSVSGRLAVQRVRVPGLARRGDRFTLAVDAGNSGNASVTSLVASIRFRAAGSDVTNGFTVTPRSSNPTSLATGGSASLEFDVTVTGSAATGDVSARVSLSGLDGSGGRGLTAMGSAEFHVPSPGSLRFVAGSGGGAVRQGGGLAVSATFANPGETPVLLGRQGIRFSGAGGSDVTSRFSIEPRPSNPSSVDPGAAVTLVLDVVASREAPAGPVTVSFEQAGRDATDGTEISGAGEASFRVSTPASLTLRALTAPARLRGAATFPVTLELSNAGEVAAELDSSTLTFGLRFGGDISTLFQVDPSGTNPLSVEPGQVATLAFSVTVSDAVPPETYVLNAKVRGHDDASQAPLSAKSKTTFAVLRPAALKIDSVTAPSVVRPGDTFPVTVVASNSGEAVADLAPAALGFRIDEADNSLDFAVTPDSANPTVLLTDGRVALAFEIAVSEAAAGGRVKLVASLAGADRETRVPLQAMRESAFVVSVPALSIDAISAPAEATQGETVPLTLTVSNPGAAPVAVTTATFSIALGALDLSSEYRFSPVAGNPQLIDAGQSVALAFVLVPAPDATTGALTVSAVLQGHPFGSSRPLRGNRTTALRLTRSSALVLRGIEAPLTVAQGGAFPVTLTIENPGDGAVLLDGATLRFEGAGALALSTASALGLPAQLSARATAMLTASVAVSGAATGDAFVSAAVVGRDQRTNAARRAVSPAVRVRVETAPRSGASLIVESIEAPAEVSQGDTFEVTMTVANTGQGGARDLAGALTFLGGQLPFQALAANPSTLAAGNRARLLYQLQAASSGRISVDGRVTGTDVRLGAPLSASGASRGPAALTVRPFATAARLSIRSVSVPGRVDRGQAASFPIRMRVENLGDASAGLAASRLSFSTTSPGDADGFFAVEADPGNPAGIDGGQTATLDFRVQIRAVAPLGLIQVDGHIVGIDGHSGSAVLADGAQDGPQGLLVVEGVRRAALRVASVTAPRTLAQRQRGRVTVRVLNEGLVEARAARARLVFSDLVGLNQSRFETTSDPGNPATIAPGAGADFAFTIAARPTALPGPVTIDAGAEAVDAASGANVAVLGAEQSARVEITLNRAPVARTGPVVTQRIMDLVRLDGTASSDPDGPDSPALLYHWSVDEVPAGSRLTTAALSDNNSVSAARPAFMADRKGTYLLRLVVADDVLESLPEPARVVIVNSEPSVSVSTFTARAMPGDTIALRTAGSDADAEDTLTYTWSIVAAPPGSRRTSAHGFSPNGAAAAFVTTFSPDVAGVYLLAVVASDGQAVSERALLAVNVVPAPSADRLLFLAPQDGDVLTIDQSAVAELQTQVTAQANPGASVTLSVNGTAVGTRQADAAGDVVFPGVTLRIGRSSTLAISAGRLSAQARVNVPGQLVPRGIVTTPGAQTGGPRLIVLDASSSFAPSGAPLIYQWRLVRMPPGAESFESTLPTTQYLASLPGAYVFELTVTSPGDLSTRRLLGFTVDTVAPVADARGARLVVLARADLVLPFPASLETGLDGSASYSPNGRPLTYSWSVVRAPDIPPGSRGESRLVTIDAGASPRPTLIFSSATLTGVDGGPLSAAGAYEVQLTVSDGPNSATDTVGVVAIDPRNLLPRADAGLGRAYAARRSPGGELLPEIPDPTVVPALDEQGRPRNLRSFVRLDGRESSDSLGRPLAYRWRIVSVPAGSRVTTLAGAQTPFPTFQPDGEGDYTFELTVGNGLYDSAPSVVTIVIGGVNQPPVSAPLVEDLARMRQAGPGHAPLVFAPGERVTLNARRSTDPDEADLARLTYAWTVVRGGSVSFEPSATAPVLSFADSRPGRRTIRLTVTDPAGARNAADLDVLLADADPLPDISIVASSSTTQATGEGFGEGFQVTSRPRSLRVLAPAVVALEARLSRTAAGRQFDYLWSQPAGPVVLLTNSGERATVSTGSVTRFSVTTSRVHQFVFTAFPLDHAGNRTGLFVRRHVRVLVDTGRSSVPEPSGAATPLTVPFSGAVLERTIQLDAAGSRLVGALAGSGLPLFYSWRQVDGPRGTFSNPFSSRTTFTVPALEGETVDRDYVLELTVDVSPPGDRSEPLYLKVTQSPPAAGPPRARVFLNGVPISVAATAPATAGADFSVAVTFPSPVPDHSLLTLELVDTAGNALSPPVVLRRVRISFAAGGRPAATFSADGDYTLDSSLLGTTTTATFGPPEPAPTPVASAGFPQENGGGCGCDFLAPATSIPWLDLALWPVTFLWIGRRRR